MEFRSIESPLFMTYNSVGLDRLEIPITRIIEDNSVKDIPDERYTGMLGQDRKYTVKKDELLAHLRSNRDKHVAEYHQAKKDRKVAAAKTLRLEAKRALAGKKFRISFPEFQPLQNHKKDYDLAIDLLTMCTADTIDITAQDYQQYVNDEWNWSRGFKTMAMSYSSVANNIRQSASSDDDEEVED